LKTGTQDLHENVEKGTLLTRVLCEDFSASEYQTLLQKFYEIYHALETKLQTLPELSEVIEDLPSRLKTGSLKKDLQAQLPLPPQALKLDSEKWNLSQALGVMYVLEGSTLGGQIIQRKLKQNPNLSGQSFHFYGHYGDQVGTYWKKFLAVLEKCSQEKEINPRESLQSARSVFQLMNDHFRVTSQDL